MDVTIICPCPPKADGAPRHVSDTVTFRDRLGFHAVMTIRKAMSVLKDTDPDAGTGEYLATMTEHYFIHGIESWTITDAKGKRIEPSRPAIRSLLEELPYETATVMVDAADGLYYEAVLGPLVRQAQASLLDTPTSSTDDMAPSSSTSRKSATQPKRRKPSKPSSTSTTPTVGIEMTMSLPDGVSSTSPSYPSGA